MGNLEIRIQKTTFDVETQYCDPRLEEHYMEKIEKRIQETTFDVEVQYCDPDDCTHDCKREGTNNCDVVITSLW